MHKVACVELLDADGRRSFCSARLRPHGVRRGHVSAVSLAARLTCLHRLPSPEQLADLRDSARPTIRLIWFR